MVEAFHIQNLSACYGISRALWDINVSLKVGESLALLGRNGMGKTTLIRSLLQLVKSSYNHPEGYRLFNADVRLWSTWKIAQWGVGYVPEGRGIFSNLLVDENLRMSMRSEKEVFMLWGESPLTNWTLERIWEMFPILYTRRRLLGGLLSGGEQQMLAIARALLTQPRLLLLDEVTEGLSPSMVVSIWRILEQLQKQGLSMVVVDKDAMNLLKHTQRALVLVKGSVVFDGASQTLMKDKEKMMAWLGG